jgi:hypothetical protein
MKVVDLCYTHDCTAMHDLVCRDILNSPYILMCCEVKRIQKLCLHYADSAFITLKLL